jgi:diguanylate cyclase
MQYKEVREQTAELLRQVLPQMARHAAGFHPMTYAVWYEYLARINPHLTAAVDARIAGCGGSLSDRDIFELYDKFVASRDAQTSAHVSAEIARLVQQVDGAAIEAGAQVRNYGAELDSYRAQLQRDIDQHQLDQVVKSLILDTARVRYTTETFQEQLKQNSQEVEQLRAELEIAQGLACRDPLTGLFNRRGFDKQVQKDWTGQDAESSLLLVDIDKFKVINDTHGHILGDKVIVAVARALQTCAGSRGPVARIGGEEFLALLLHTSGDTAAGVAEQVRAAVERGRIRRAEGADAVGGVTVSVGIANWRAGEPFESLLQRADRALYQSKSSGRNRVTLAQADIASVA